MERNALLPPSHDFEDEEIVSGLVSSLVEDVPPPPPPLVSHFIRNDNGGIDALVLTTEDIRSWMKDTIGAAMQNRLSIKQEPLPLRIGITIPAPFFFTTFNTLEYVFEKDHEIESFFGEWSKRVFKNDAGTSYVRAPLSMKVDPDSSHCSISLNCEVFNEFNTLQWPMHFHTEVCFFLLLYNIYLKIIVYLHFKYRI